MALENPLFLTPFLGGAVFVVTGFLTLKFPPKKINGFYGYRTPGSVKSKERWKFAQKYGARQMLKFGLILMLVSAPGLIYQPSQGIAILLGLVEVVGVVVVMIARVESALEKEFND